MNSDGPAILNSVRRMRVLMSDVSQLLQQCDAAIAPEGWLPLAGKSDARWGISYSLYQPEKWMVYFACRGYANDQQAPGLLAMVAVVLDYPEQLQLLDQPLITVSWAKHPHAKVAWSDFDGRYLFAHLLRKVPTADGCFRLFAADELADLLARCKKDLVAFSSMALPLVQVADRQTLKEKVVDPLLGELRK